MRKALVFVAGATAGTAVGGAFTAYVFLKSFREPILDSVSKKVADTVEKACEYIYQHPAPYGTMTKETGDNGKVKYLYRKAR